MIKVKYYIIAMNSIIIWHHDWSITKLQGAFLFSRHPKLFCKCVTIPLDFVCASCIARGGGGGDVSLGPVHHPRQSLSEKHPKWGWSDGTHSSLNTTLHVRTAGYRSQISYLFRGSVNLIPIFKYLPVFDTLNAIRAGWRNRYHFYVFLLTRMMYRPQWDMPPPPTPPPGLYRHITFIHWWHWYITCIYKWTFQMVSNPHTNTHRISPST